MIEESNLFNNLFNSDSENYENSFKSSINAVNLTFKKYSIEDIALSLFVSNIWLPNISSTVTHQFLTAIFATLNPEQFSGEKSIKTYEDFKEFLSDIYELCPSFPDLEDFIPELDWGEIKFYFNKKNYCIFYGNELNNVHEYLMLFQMIYCPYDEEYHMLLKKSPELELKYCLELQEKIIQEITTQPNEDDIKISCGHREIPPQYFWENARIFYSNFKPETIVPGNFIEDFSINIGEYKIEALEYKNFGEQILNGTLVPSLFLKHKDNTYIILPRRFSSILIDCWAEIFKKFNEKIEPDMLKYTLCLGGELHRYIKGRINNEMLPVVSPVTSEGQSCKLIFTSSFISDNNLFLIYLTEPSCNSKKTEDELIKIAPELVNALKLINNQPTTLASHLDKQYVQFKSQSNQNKLEPLLLVIIPQISTQLGVISVPEDFPGKVLFLDSFLGIIDELDRDIKLSDFFKYLEKTDAKNYLRLSMFDMFASFKDSYGTLIEGALNPDFIILDPHWGTNTRFKSLLEFWKIFPDINYFGHPRIWKVKKETKTRVRLEARGYFGSAIYTKCRRTNVFLTAPFQYMNYSQGNLSNLLMEWLEDAMSKRCSIFNIHEFFEQCTKFQILFVPISIVFENENFSYLRHLGKIEKNWNFDMLWLNDQTYGIRIVFDENAMQKAFMEAQNCSLEVDLLIEILTMINKSFPDPQLGNIFKSLEETRSGKPRFRLFTEEKPAIFPEFISPFKPKIGHFKRAKKRIAELALQQNIITGNYQLKEAKATLNILRDSIIAEINTQLKKFDYKKAIIFLITRVDALNYEHETRRSTIDHASELDVDFQLETEYAKQHEKFIKTHKNFRYLIEKFVQINPTGEEILEKDQFQYLVALIDWLHVFYSASDHLHYGLYSVGMKINSDFIVEIIYDDDMEEKNKSFTEIMSKIQLGIMGNMDDKVVSPRPVEEFLEFLDAAFTTDLGFSFKTMINVLQILSCWPTYRKDAKESSSYSATITEIQDVCSEIIIAKFSTDEILRIVDFLTLKQDEVCRIVGREEPCADIPIWEHRKRYARYNIKPLIKIEDQFFWGPYSARRSGIIWSSITSDSKLPADLNANSIEDALRTEKELIENALADKTYEIVNRHTIYLRKNLELHNLKPKGIHPQELGDYDVLSFHQQLNVVLCIECKDILQPYCLKDTKRLREKIFGTPGKNKGHFDKIDRRVEYLKKNIIQICTALDWPITTTLPPQVISLYVIRRTYWWTEFPPVEVETKFVRVDLLSNFMENLNKLSNPKELSPRML